MFDPRVEPPLSLTDACKLKWLRTRRGRPNVKTLHRWATAGKNGVKLETINMGAGKFTSESRILAFLERAENAGSGPSAAAVGEQRAKDLASAAATLAAAGI